MMGVKKKMIPKKKIHFITIKNWEGYLFLAKQPSQFDNGFTRL